MRCRLRRTAYTDSNSKAPLSNEITWPKRGGRTTSHFGDGVSFHGAHTHCCILLVVKRIFWRQSYRCRSGRYPEQKQDGWAASTPQSWYAQSAYAVRKRGVLFAHLKCAPVRRALSATDSVCSLLQDGGSAPIHFLLIASQLSLSIRGKTLRFPTKPSGKSHSISSLTNRGRGGGSGTVLLCFSTHQSSGGWGAFNGGCSDNRRGALCVSAHHFFRKRCSNLTHKQELPPMLTLSCTV